MDRTSNLSLHWFRSYALSIILSFGTVLSGCAPWRQEVLSTTQDSMLLQHINFQKYKDGEFKIYFKNKFSSSQPPDKLKVEQITNKFLQETGSSSHLSDVALDYLKKDKFICSNDSCKRDFVRSYAYGTAFIPFNVQTGFSRNLNLYRLGLF